MPNDFRPTFPGVMPCRLPWRSVYANVVPCVLDNRLSLLELIAKMQFVINNYTAAIEANHTDIVNLNAYVVQLETDLRAYIDAQDAVTLASANAYTDAAAAELNAAIASLREYVDTQDAATLSSAKNYTVNAIATLRAYVDAQLALKQDLLTFDQVPTDGSTNPVESNGIYDALALKLDASRVTDDITEDSTDVITSGAVYGLQQQLAAAIPVYINVTLNKGTGDVTPDSPSAFAEAMAYANVNRETVLRVSYTDAYRNDLMFMHLGLRSGSQSLIYFNHAGTITATASGWTYTQA